MTAIKNTFVRALPAGQAGFTLFIAVITTSIVLAIGISILNITLKEFILSGIARESEMAFYAADAGMECALYWDFSNEASEGGGEGAFDMYPRDSRTIDCMGNTAEAFGGGRVAKVGGKKPSERNEFQVEWGSPVLCAQVTVTKNTGGSCKGNVCTVVESRGYNRACNALTDPRIVERALRSNY